MVNLVDKDKDDNSAGKRWRLLYLATIGFLLIQIIFYYIITVFYK